MIDFKKVKFIKSAPNKQEKPGEIFPELLFVGRSNVGKSTLINSLLGQKMAFVSSKPGHTKLLNYFLVDNKFYLVDAPGYGYTKSGSKFDDPFSEMMEDYFDNEDLKGVIFIVDSRIVPTVDDIDFFNFVNESGINYLIVASKTDKLNQSEKSKIMKNFSSAFKGLDESKVCYSALGNNKLIENIRAKVANLLAK